MRYSYNTTGVCSRQINFDINGDYITNISFVCGCDGNLKAIAKLCDGMTVDKIEETLKGNTCGWKPTSCADQLAIAVRQAWNETHSA